MGHRLIYNDLNENCLRAHIGIVPGLPYFYRRCRGQRLDIFYWIVARDEAQRVRPPLRPPTFSERIPNFIPLTTLEHHGGKTTG